VNVGDVTLKRLTALEKSGGCCLKERANTGFLAESLSPPILHLAKIAERIPRSLLKKATLRSELEIPRASGPSVVQKNSRLSLGEGNWLAWRLSDNGFRVGETTLHGSRTGKINLRKD